MTQSGAQSEPPLLATVEGVKDSDITRNLMAATVEDIFAGEPVQAVATFTAFLQAIGYSERRAE